MASALNCTSADIIPALEALQQEGAVRLGGRLCGSSYWQCATHNCDVSENAWNDERIIISLLKEAEL
jgi:hypothetical protein